MRSNPDFDTIATDVSLDEDGSRRGRVLWSIIIGLAAVALMLLHTMWPTAAGQAPHPDGDRYLCQLEPDNLAPENSDAPRYWAVAHFRWTPDGESPAECIRYPSSQLLILRGLQGLTQLSGDVPGALDFRWGLALYAVFAGIVVGLFTYALKSRLRVRVILATLLLFIIGDATFASYAAGPMGELPGILGVVLVAVGAVYLGTRGVRQWFGLLLVALGSLLALTSKLQAITLVVPLVCFLIGSRMRWTGRTERSARGVRRVLGMVVGHAVPALVGLSLILPAVWMLDNNPKHFQAINPWETISVGILTQSDDPAADLAEMGFPTSLAQYAGKTACDDGCAVQLEPDWIASKDNMTYGTVAKFLLRHPSYVLGMASVNAGDFFTVRPAYLASFAAEDAPAESQAFSPMATAGKLLQPGGLPLLLLVWVVLGGLAWFWRKRSGIGTWRRSFNNASILMVLFAVFQFVTAAYGEAIENTKHQIFAILATALAGVLLLAAGFSERPEQLSADSSLDAGAGAGAGDGADAGVDAASGPAGAALPERPVAAN